MKILPKIILSVLALLLVGFGIYVYSQRENEPVTSEVTHMTPHTLKKQTETLSIDITYPTVPGEGKDVDSANAFLKSEIDTQLALFQKDADDSAQNTDIGLPANIKSSITGSGSVEEVNARYASITMGTEWYIRGAAHPGHSMTTYIYDYKEKKFLSVEDLFTQGSDYLGLLSKLSKADLYEQSRSGDMGFSYDEGAVTDGTKPTKENFSTVLPLKDGLAIYFGEYQVGPYAAGPQQVVIPYIKLRDVINKDGLLGMYIQ